MSKVKCGMDIKSCVEKANYRLCN